VLAIALTADDRSIGIVCLTVFILMDYRLRSTYIEHGYYYSERCDGLVGRELSLGPESKDSLDSQFGQQFVFHPHPFQTGTHGVIFSMGHPWCYFLDGAHRCKQKVF